MTMKKFTALLSIAVLMLCASFKSETQDDVNRFNITMKQGATAIDAVNLVNETAARHKDSAAVREIVDACGSIDQVEAPAAWLHKVFHHISSATTYQLDEAGKEQIRTPDRFLLKDTFGDCDDYTVLWSALLRNQGVAHIVKIVSYTDGEQWAHIYPQALVLNDAGQAVKVTVDNVLQELRAKRDGRDYFGIEVEYRRAKEFLIKQA